MVGSWVWLGIGGEVLPGELGGFKRLTEQVDGACDDEEGVMGARECDPAAEGVMKG
jgi:hypothetical protein